MSACAGARGCRDVHHAHSAGARRKFPTASAGSERTSEPGARPGEDLQPAVAADTVEGAPGRRLGRYRCSGECAGRAFEHMQHEIESAGVAGSQQDPLGHVHADSRRHGRGQLPALSDRQRQPDFSSLAEP